MPNAANMLGSIPVQIDPRQFVMLVNNFIGGIVHDKQMVVYESSELGIKAQSNVIDGEIFEIRTNNSEQYIIFRLIIIDPDTHEQKERVMKFNYTDILRDMMISQPNQMGHDLSEVWNRQWDTLRRISDEQWEQLTKKREEGKLTFKNPSLK